MEFFVILGVTTKAFTVILKDIMISSTNQIKHMMEEFEREDRAKQKFMVNSDKYIFSTFDDFSDVPDEDDGMQATLITQ